MCVLPEYVVYVCLCTEAERVAVSKRQDGQRLAQPGARHLTRLADPGILLALLPPTLALQMHSTTPASMWALRTQILAIICPAGSFLTQPPPQPLKICSLSLYFEC